MKCSREERIAVCKWRWRMVLDGAIWFAPNGGWLWRDPATHTVEPIRYCPSCGGELPTLDGERLWGDI